MLDRAATRLKRHAAWRRRTSEPPAQPNAEQRECSRTTQPDWGGQTNVPNGRLPRLHADGISYEIGGRRLLDHVHISLMPAEVLVLVGPNGAGKSTLLNALAGDLRPTEGHVLLDGRVLAEYRPEELAVRRAVLLQQVVLQFAFTAQEVVAMGRYPHRYRRAEAPDEEERAVHRAMRHTETLDLAGRSFPTLSGGEQERVSLARVLAQESPILLLDEPTSSLDIRHQQLVMGIARDLAERGASVLTILHDLNLAAAYADRIGLLQHGRLVVCGSPWEVLSESTLSHVFDHPITVMPHPARDCPLIIPLPHRDRCAASTPHAIGCHEFSA